MTKLWLVRCRTCGFEATMEAVVGCTSCGRPEPAGMCRCGCRIARCERCLVEVGAADGKHQYYVAAELTEEEETT